MYFVCGENKYVLNCGVGTNLLVGGDLLRFPVRLWCGLGWEVWGRRNQDERIYEKSIDIVFGLEECGVFDNGLAVC